MQVDLDQWVLQFIVAMQQINPARSCDVASDKALARVVYRGAYSFDPVVVAQVFAVAAKWFEAPDQRWSRQDEAADALTARAERTSV